MHIRNATYHDAPAIKILLEALGYTTRMSLLVNQLETMFGKDDHQVLVYELKKDVVGFVSVHFLPQLAFDGGLMVVTYLAIDDGVNNTGVAKELEQHITNLARLRKCKQIHLHCLDCWAQVHQFYLQQGYQEYSKYFTKKLVYESRP